MWHHQSLIIFRISCRQTTYPKLIIAFIAVSDTFTRADLWPQEAIQDTVANGYLEACQMKRDWQRRLGTASSAVNTELGKDITGKSVQSKHFLRWAVDVKSLAQLAQSFAAVIAWWELIILIAAWKYFHTRKKCQNVKIKTDRQPVGPVINCTATGTWVIFFRGCCVISMAFKRTLTSVSFKLGGLAEEIKTAMRGKKNRINSFLQISIKSKYRVKIKPFKNIIIITEGIKQQKKNIQHSVF